MRTRVSALAEILILAVVYFAIASLSFETHVVDGFQALIWAPEGVGLAAVLLRGNRMALGIFLGVVASMDTSNHSLLTGIGIGALEAVEAVGAAWLLRRVFGFRTQLDRVRDVLVFLGTASLFTCATAALDSGLLVATGLLPYHRIPELLMTWWWGYLAGCLVVTPALLVWGTRPYRGIPRRVSAFEIVAFGATMLVLCGYVFGPPIAALLSARSPYLVVILLLWAGLRFGPQGASATTFAITALAILATNYGYGPFTHPHRLQIFISVSSVTTLVLAALQVERLAAVRDLKESHALLEQRVRERTAELVAANDELQRRGVTLRNSQALAHLGSFERVLDQDRLEWTEEMYEIYGQDPSSFDPREFPSRIHPDDRVRVVEIIQRAHDDHLPFAFEMRIVRSDGTIRSVESRGRVYVDDATQTVRVTGFTQDITERKNAEQVSRRLGELVESSADAIIGLTVDGTIESWNHAAEKTFGYAAAEAIGKPASMLVPEGRAGELEKVLACVRAGQHLDHYEFEHVRRDNRRFDASVTTSPILDSHGRVIGISKVVRDVSDKTLAEHELRSALREKEVLLREIHHRVKNNLQVIASLLNLQASTVESAEARNRLEESQSRIQSMALVHQLLYRSKDLAHIDLREYMHDLVARLSQAFGGDQDPLIEITVDFPEIRLDIDRSIACGLIVNELVTNSYHHAFPAQRHGSIRVALRLEGGALVLEVIDDGTGMPTDFDLDNAHTLGLQIVRTLADQLGGKLALTSHDGTCARVVFPFDESMSPEARGGQQPARPAASA